MPDDTSEDKKYVHVRERQSVYMVPDYATTQSGMRSHKSNTNIIGVLSTVFMFLTMMGAVTAAWVTMSERQAKTETFQQLKFEAYQEVLGGIRRDVIENRNSIARNRRELDERFRVIMETNTAMSVQLARIQSMLEKKQ